MSDLITRRLLAVAGVWAALAIASPTVDATLGSIAGTVVMAVAVLAIAKLAVVKSKAAVSARRASSDA